MDYGSQTGLVEVGSGIWAIIMSIIPPEGGGPNAGFIVTGDCVVVIDSLISPGYGRQLWLCTWSHHLDWVGGH